MKMGTIPVLKPAEAAAILERFWMVMKEYFKKNLP